MRQKNKEDILDKILKKFLDILEETSLESSDLKKNLDNIEQLYHYGSELFKKQLNNMEIIKIWRIINIEKYHNEKTTLLLAYEKLDQAAADRK